MEGLFWQCCDQVSIPSFCQRAPEGLLLNRNSGRCRVDASLKEGLRRRWMLGLAKLQEDAGDAPAASNASCASTL